MSRLGAGAQIRHVATGGRWSHDEHVHHHHGAGARALTARDGPAQRRRVVVEPGLLGAWPTRLGRFATPDAHHDPEDLALAFALVGAALDDLAAGAELAAYDAIEYAAADALVESLVVNGQPAAALLQEAAEHDIDLILMGSTGVGWVRGAVLGSVSSHVVEHARCSVMVFRAGRASSPAHVGSIVVGVDGSRGAATRSPWPRSLQRR